MGNKPVEIIPGVPKDVGGLRKGMIEAILASMKSGIPSYGGPMAGMDPLQMMASNLMAKQMGYGGYGGPNMIQAPQFPQQGFGAGFNYNSGPLPIVDPNKPGPRGGGVDSPSRGRRNPDDPWGPSKPRGRYDAR